MAELWCCGRSAADNKVYSRLFVSTLLYVAAGQLSEPGPMPRPEDWPSEIVDIYSLPRSQPQFSHTHPHPISQPSSRPFRPATPTPPLLSWLLKLLINACVFYFFGFLLQIHLVTALAIEGVYYHAEGATPFRLGCTRRERHFNLCAYPFPLCILIAHTLLDREFYHRTSAQLRRSASG